MQSKNDLVLIGRFGAPHGIRGWVKVHSFTEEPADIFNYINWNVSYANNKSMFAAEVIEYKAHQSAFVVRLASIEDRDEVAKLTNSDIYVSRDELPNLDNDQHYWHDLIGMQVVNELAQALGVVNHFMNTGANDIMVVTGEDKKKILIPYVPDMYIHKVDTAARTITVNWAMEA
jgi:16S rRNA processing protein RimM